MKAPLSRPTSLAIGAAIFALAASAEFAMGRRLWGINNVAGVWSGDIWSSHNSQFLADPYSFSHLTHGMLMFGVCWLIASSWPVHMRALMTLIAEASWEVIENTDLMIRRYRAATISLNYYGDSVANSMSDIVFCMLGFSIAYLLPTRVTIALVILLEVGLALWIRDSLLLNIVMLIHPIPAIRGWQSGN